jgi:TIGR01440 family protein
MSDVDSMVHSQQASVVKQAVQTIVSELVTAGGIKRGQLVVIGCSTSEVLGKRIGTSGTMDAAEAIFAGVEAVRQQAGFYPVYQCCEHLNRALVLEREAAERYGLDEVAAVPVQKAGGSMAAYAYRHLNDAVLVESVRAHAGVDIGDTFIGMHLRPVAVPVRPTIRSIGQAHVTMAYSRPKLIGGARAVYTLEDKAEPERPGGTCE